MPIDNCVGTRCKLNQVIDRTNALTKMVEELRTAVVELREYYIAVYPTIVENARNSGMKVKSRAKFHVKVRECLRKIRGKMKRNKQESQPSYLMHARTQEEQKLEEDIDGPSRESSPISKSPSPTNGSICVRDVDSFTTDSLTLQNSTSQAGHEREVTKNKEAKSLTSPSPRAQKEQARSFWESSSSEEKLEPPSNSFECYCPPPMNYPWRTEQSKIDQPTTSVCVNHGRKTESKTPEEKPDRVCTRDVKKNETSKVKEELRKENEAKNNERSREDFGALLWKYLPKMRGKDTCGCPKNSPCLKGGVCRTHCPSMAEQLCKVLRMSVYKTNCEPKERKSNNALSKSTINSIKTSGHKGTRSPPFQPIRPSKTWHARNGSFGEKKTNSSTESNRGIMHSRNTSNVKYPPRNVEQSNSNYNFLQSQPQVQLRPNVKLGSNVSPKYFRYTSGDATANEQIIREALKNCKTIHPRKIMKDADSQTRKSDWQNYYLGDYTIYDFVEHFENESKTDIARCAKGKSKRFTPNCDILYSTYRRENNPLLRGNLSSSGCPEARNL